MANTGTWIDTCPECGGESLRASVRTLATYNIRNECGFQTWAHHETSPEGQTECIECLDCGEQWGPEGFEFDKEGNLIGLHDSDAKGGE